MSNGQRKWVMIGIGGGGGKVAADFILYSRYLRHIASSVYFLNTAGEDLSTLKEVRLKKVYENQWIWDIMDGKTGKTGLPVDYIKFGLHGTGNNFVRSQQLLKKHILESTEFSSERHTKEKINDLERSRDTEKNPVTEKKEQNGEKGRYDFDLLTSLSESGTDSHPIEKNRVLLEIGGLHHLHNDLIDAQHVFLVHSLGGGTGGGSAPLLARWIKEKFGQGLTEPTVISICFLASKVDGPFRMANSLHNLMNISREADIVLLFSNETLLKDINIEEVGNEEKKEEEYLRMNERIVKAVDILFSPTAAPELGGCVNVEFDPQNLKTYLRMIFDEGGSPFAVNIVVPFISIEEKRSLSVPIAFYYALGAKQVPIFKNSLMNLVPIFLSSNMKICKEKFFSDNLDIYNDQIRARGLQSDFDVMMESLTSVADPEYKKGSQDIDVLALGLAKLNLEQYRKVLEHPMVLTRWANFYKGTSKTAEGQARKIMEWMDTYNKKIDEFNEKMANYSRKIAEYSGRRVSK